MSQIGDTALQNLVQVLTALVGKTSALNNTPVTTATAGTAGAPPAQVAGYFTIVGSDGNTYKVPAYKP